MTSELVDKLEELIDEKAKLSAFFNFYIPAIKRSTEEKIDSAAKNIKMLEHICALSDRISNRYPDKIQNAETLFDVFELGAHYGRFVQGWESEWTTEELQNHLKAFMSEQKSRIPFDKKAITLQHIKEVTQNIASDLWKKDTEKKIRVAEMCDLVWDKIDQELDTIKNHPEYEEVDRLWRQHFPTKPEHLKKNIREVAPEWAKRGGAPKGPHKPKRKQPL